MEKKRRALREVLESSDVRRSDRDWSKVKRKISHRSAYSNLGEADARKTWELWSREEGGAGGAASVGSGGGKKAHKRERSRESPPEDRHDRKRVLAEEKEEGEA